MPVDTHLRMPQVVAKVGLARSTIYKMIRSGDFPPPRKLTRRASGWRERDVESFLEGLKSSTPTSPR